MEKGKSNYRFFMHKTHIKFWRVSLELFVKQTFWFWGYWAYCSLDTFFCANILICYIMQKQIHSTYLYKLFYLKWQLGLLDIENKEIIWYEFVKPNWNLFENFPKLIRIAEKKKKSNNYHTWDIVQQKKGYMIWAG